MEAKIAAYLQDMRNVITRSKEGSMKSAQELLDLLTGKSEWTEEECVKIYESILRHYIVDDPESLELMLAVSGLLDGYRNPLWSAAARRGKYLSDNPGAEKIKYDESSLRKREDKIIRELIAPQLKEDFDSKKIPQLIEQWLSSEETAESIDLPEKDMGTPIARPQVQKTSGISGKVLYHGGNVNKKGKTNIQFSLLNFINYGNRNQQSSTINHIQPPEEPANKHKSHKYRWILAALGIVLLLAIYFDGHDPFGTYPVAEILVSDQEIILKPGDIAQLPVAVLPLKAQNAPLSYISDNTNIVTVSNKGFVTAQGCDQGVSFQTAEITIQAESGATATKCITVQNEISSSNPSAIEIDDFKPDFTIEQKVRLAGTKEWKTNVNAEVGDKVEFQVEYKNIGKNQRHTDVMIKDVIADNLQYVPGSTILYNANHPNGAVYNEDTLTTTGVNIGNYQTNGNAFVRFTAIVVDKSLEYGSNTLVNWIKGTDENVALQDYATVMVQKAQ